jgi:acyl carrier protein
MKAIILAHDAEQEFNIEWPLEMFLEITTIRKIADTGMELMRNSSHLP